MRELGSRSIAGKTSASTWKLSFRHSRNQQPIPVDQDRRFSCCRFSTGSSWLLSPTFSRRFSHAAYDMHGLQLGQVVEHAAQSWTQFLPFHPGVRGDLQSQRSMVFISRLLKHSFQEHPNELVRLLRDEREVRLRLHTEHAIQSIAVNPLPIVVGLGCRDH